MCGGVQLITLACDVHGLLVVQDRRTLNTNFSPAMKF
jgi:hypothetical protein